MTASRPNIDIIISIPTNTMRCSALQTVLSHHCGNGFDKTDLPTAVQSVRRAITMAVSTIAPLGDEASFATSGRPLGTATVIITEDGVPVASAHIGSQNTHKMGGKLAEVWGSLKTEQDRRFTPDWGRTGK